MARLLFLLAALVGLLSPIVYLMEQRLESFYIFDKDHLHDLSKRAIAAHGNDTRSVVSYIVSELHGNPAQASHVNLDEEWIFNNAGGAMGAMYIIHASMFTMNTTHTPTHTHTNKTTDTIKNPKASPNT
jgi:C-8 sterol isomerase